MRIISRILFLLIPAAIVVGTPLSLGYRSVAPESPTTKTGGLGSDEPSQTPCDEQPGGDSKPELLVLTRVDSLEPTQRCSRLQNRSHVSMPGFGRPRRLAEAGGAARPRLDRLMADVPCTILVGRVLAMTFRLHAPPSIAS